MALPERKRRGRYNRYLEEDNPLEKMPRRTRYRYNKTLSATTSATIDGKYNYKLYPSRSIIIV